MCGIFAIFRDRPLDEDDIALGRAGTAALSHRGPDAAGEWMDREAGVFLGHRRLSIIDPRAESDQPMGRNGAQLSFNGEIYNYTELRAALAGKGARFATTSDTEVLLELLTRQGRECLARLDGMFAFAFWDGRAGLLAVDAFGEKPLFWAETPRGVYVSSELAPLARLLEATKDFTGAKLAAYLALGFIPAPDTAFEAIHRLPPASFLEVRGGRAGPVRRFWSPPRGEPGTGAVTPLAEKALDRVAECLAESLMRRLRADVPLCLFLSRGVDSALVAALARRELNVDVHALTIAFPGGRIHSEEKEAALIAAHLGHAHEIIACESGDDSTGTDSLLALYGEPHDNISIFPVRQMAQVAARRYKVALTGTGGDELFFGYNKHWFFYRFRNLFALPSPLRRAAGALARPFESVDQRAAQLSTVFALKRCMFYFANKNYPAGRWLAGVPGIEDFACSRFGDARAPLELEVPRYELGEAFPQSQLQSMDLGSMRESLELRTPFLSTALVSLLAEFDPRALIAFGRKSVLQRILARYLPAELMLPRKSGLVFPGSVFLDQAPPTPPRVPGLDEDRARAAWSRRADGPGWTRIATRLMIADAFHGSAPDAVSTR